MAISALFTSQEIAHQLDLKEQTLRKWRHENRGPKYIRMGDGSRAPIRYRWSDIEEWLAERTFSSTKQEADHWRKKK